MGDASNTSKVRPTLAGTATAADTGLGRAAVKALLSPAYSKVKNAPPIADEAAAIHFLTTTIPYAFYLRVDRGDHLPPPPPQAGQAPQKPQDQPRALRIAQMQKFTPDDYFVFLIEGSQLKVYAGGIGMVAVVLAGCMFPLWPSSMRVGVWYLSIAVLGLIGAFFGLAIVRLIFWMITKVAAKPGIWIFPKLFEDVGFVGVLRFVEGS
jgi:translocation protein SEC62